MTMTITITSWIMLALALVIALQSGQLLLILAVLIGNLGALTLGDSAVGRRGRP